MITSKVVSKAVEPYCAPIAMIFDTTDTVVLFTSEHDGIYLIHGVHKTGESARDLISLNSGRWTPFEGEILMKFSK